MQTLQLAAILPSYLALVKCSSKGTALEFYSNALFNY